MLTTKQRSSLRGLANELKPVMQIGKGGVTESLLKQAEEHLFSSELIKVKILQSADLSAKEIGNDFAAKLNAEIVSAIGNVITVYKFSDKKGIEHIKY
ncbi:MAG: ribosome assembly RNA-binding protein YhbY [Clostridia bacterium]